jgi:hypothetical protein
VTDAKELADRYVNLWNEPDAARRRQLIVELWTEDGAHLLQPPQEMCELAARPGIGLTAGLDARGHAALEARVTSAYEEFVAQERSPSGGGTTSNASPTSSSSTGRWSPPTARWPPSASSSSFSPQTAASGATTSSSSLERAPHWNGRRHVGHQHSSIRLSANRWPLGVAAANLPHVIAMALKP